MRSSFELQMKLFPDYTAVFDVNAWTTQFPLTRVKLPNQPIGILMKRNIWQEIYKYLSLMEQSI